MGWICGLQLRLWSLRLIVVGRWALWWLFKTAVFIKSWFYRCVYLSKFLFYGKGNWLTGLRIEIVSYVYILWPLRLYCLCLLCEVGKLWGISPSNTNCIYLLLENRSLLLQSISIVCWIRFLFLSWSKYTGWVLWCFFCLCFWSLRCVLSIWI